jgi:hypothetical protein
MMIFGLGISPVNPESQGACLSFPAGALGLMQFGGNAVDLRGELHYNRRPVKHGCGRRFR